MKTQSPEMEKWNDDVPGCEHRIADLAEREAHVRRAVLPPDVEFNSPAYWERMRRMTRKEAWRENAIMTSMLFDEVRAETKADHPHWNQQKQNIELVARMYGPTLAGRYRRYMEKRSTNEHFS
ncbi:MAG TPA: hypothetical protein VNA16_02345 [Abditibacteriaceae bacterium]|nr:hypothetical protein [Abditibacteriaceae bacterium]